MGLNMANCAMRFVVLVAVLAVFMFSRTTTVRAGEGWDRATIEAWLDEPGVRLLAVEFYATWCKPCVEAVPKWRRLQETYRERGLRFVIISVQDNRGKCARPPQWTPDHIVCDDSGAIADAWGVADLPQAFLWSWQGNLLAMRADVEQVETAISRYVKNSPRILVDTPVDGQGEPLAHGEILRKIIGVEIATSSKFDLLADERERDALRRLRKASYQANRDELYKCVLGMELSANSLLRTTVAEVSGKKYLFLELMSAEKECVLAAVRTPVGKDYEMAIKKGVAELVARISPTIRMPTLIGQDATSTTAPLTVALTRERQEPNKIKTDLAGRLTELAEKKKKLEEIHHEWLDVLAYIRRPEHSNQKKTARVAEFIRDHSQDNPFRKLAANHLAALKLSGGGGGNWTFGEKEDQERYTVSEEAAFDTSTGLMWQRKSPEIMMTWEQGIAYCQGPVNTLMKGERWRLPRRDELETLRAGRAAEAGCYWAGSIFEGICTLYWSGTLDIFAESSGFAVSFGSNRVDSMMTSVGMPVRCVTDEFSP